MPPEDLDKVMALVAKYPRCWVFSDEIYSQLTYDGALSRTAGSQTSAQLGSWMVLVTSCGGASGLGTPKSALNYPEMRERTVAIDGFSKTYCMTGWRARTRMPCTVKSFRDDDLLTLARLGMNRSWLGGDARATCCPGASVHDTHHRVQCFLHTDRRYCSPFGTARYAGGDGH